MLERRVVLEDEADAALLRRHAGRVLAGDEDLAGVGLLEPGDHAQQRRLAAAARAEQRGQRAGRDLERDVVERDEVAEPLRDCAATMLRRFPPGSDQGHGDEHEHRHEREHDRDRVRAGEVERLVALLDAERRRLRLALEPPGDDGDGAVLAEAARGREDDAVDDGPADRRQRDPPERLPGDAPSVRAACSCSSPISRSVGTTSRATNGSETKIVAITIAGSEKSTSMPCRRASRRTSRPGRRAGRARGRRRPARARAAGRRTR